MMKEATGQAILDAVHVNTCAVSKGSMQNPSDGTLPATAPATPQELPRAWQRCAPRIIAVARCLCAAGSLPEGCSQALPEHCHKKQACCSSASDGTS